MVYSSRFRPQQLSLLQIATFTTSPWVLTLVVWCHQMTSSLPSGHGEDFLLWPCPDPDPPLSFCVHRKTAQTRVYMCWELKVYNPLLSGRISAASVGLWMYFNSSSGPFEVCKPRLLGTDICVFGTASKSTFSAAGVLSRSLHRVVCASLLFTGG